MMICAAFIGVAQQQIPFSQYYVDPKFAEEIAPAKVEDLRANNPAELVRMHYTMFNYALVIEKLWDANFQQMGMLEKKRSPAPASAPRQNKRYSGRGTPACRFSPEAPPSVP